jgi:hypothetical protein
MRGYPKFGFFHGGAVNEHWMGRLQERTMSQLEEQNLAAFVDGEYQQFTLSNVARMRSYMLADNEFVELCKSTASALLYRADVIIIGLQTQRSLDVTFAAIAKVMPDYPGFYSISDVMSGRITLKLFAKIQLFESELYAHVQSLITNDGSWFISRGAESEVEARQFWDRIEQKGF